MLNFRSLFWLFYFQIAHSLASFNFSLCKVFVLKTHLNQVQLFSKEFSWLLLIRLFFEYIFLNNLFPLELTINSLNVMCKSGWLNVFWFWNLKYSALFYTLFTVAQITHYHFISLSVIEPLIIHIWLNIFHI